MKTIKILIILTALGLSAQDSPPAKVPAKAVSAKETPAKDEVPKDSPAKNTVPAKDVPLPGAGKSLWTDGSPYSSASGAKTFRTGMIIRVVIRDGIKGDYTFESAKDETVVIRSAPDKKIVPELMGYTSDRTIARKGNGKEKSNAKVLGTIAVTVVDKDDNGNLLLEGKREANFEKGRSSLSVSGKINPEDLRDGNTVYSDYVADLVIIYDASPVKTELKDPDLKMKPAKLPNGQPQINRDNGTPMEKAEMNETEKQKIILKNIKRLLGESE